MNTRILNNQVSVNHGGVWVDGNSHAWSEWWRCHELRDNPICAERAREIRAALEMVGFFKEAA